MVAIEALNTITKEITLTSSHPSGWSWVLEVPKKLVRVCVCIIYIPLINPRRRRRKKKGRKGDEAPEPSNEPNWNLHFCLLCLISSAASWRAQIIFKIRWRRRRRQSARERQGLRGARRWRATCQAAQKPCIWFPIRFSFLPAQRW